MKKIFLLFLAISILMFTGCNKKNDDSLNTVNLNENKTVDFDLRSQDTDIPDVVASAKEFTIKKSTFLKELRINQFSYALRHGESIFNTKEGKALLIGLKNSLANILARDYYVQKFAKDNRITVDKSEVDARYESLKKDLQNPISKEYIEKYNIKEEDFKKSIEDELYYIRTYDLIKRSIESEQKERDTISSRIVQVKAQHILVEDKNKADELYAELSKDPSLFNDRAKEFSIDTSNKDKGGDLGYFTHETMVKPFADAAFNAEVGKVTKPVQTQFGYHLIFVNDKRNLEQMKAQGVDSQQIEAIRNGEFKKLVDERLNAVISELSADSDLQVHQFIQAQ